MKEPIKVGDRVTITRGADKGQSATVRALYEPSNVHPKGSAAVWTDGAYTQDWQWYGLGSLRREPDQDSHEK